MGGHAEVPPRFAQGQGGEALSPGFAAQGLLSLTLQLLVQSSPGTLRPRRAGRPGRGPLGPSSPLGLLSALPALPQHWVERNDRLGGPEVPCSLLLCAQL